jgi:tetratricopeptide (TPR) repeat protein
MTQSEEAFDQQIPVKGDLSKLLEKCFELVERYEYDLALKFCDKILVIEPNQLDALQLKATILIDMDENEAAREVLMNAVAADPENGAEKYIALAQLSEGQNALDLFQTALRILRQSPPEDEQDVELVKRQVAGVYCSMAELYLTDLCLEEDAEARCEQYVTAALESHPNDYEALQTMANMRISQSKPEEAAELLQKSMEIWTEMAFEDVDYPSYEFKLTCARLLVELGVFSIAQQILEVLSQEDDDIVEVWYLLALSLFSQGSLSSANDALLNAERLLAGDERFLELAEAAAELREVIGAPETIDADMDDIDTDVNEVEDEDGERDSEEDSPMEQ